MKRNRNVGLVVPALIVAFTFLACIGPGVDPPSDSVGGGSGGSGGAGAIGGVGAGAGGIGGTAAAGGQGGFGGIGGSGGGSDMDAGVSPDSGDTMDATLPDAEDEDAGI